MKKIKYILVLVFTVSFIAHAEKIYDVPVRIDFSGLPKPAQTFVDTYFSEYNYLYAYANSFYKVQFKGNIIILFDLAGEWFTVAGNGDAIPTGYIDSRVTKAISEKYPEGKITKIAKEKNRYEVKLVNGTKITLDLEGNITKVKGRK